MSKLDLDFLVPENAHFERVTIGANPYVAVATGAESHLPAAPLPASTAADAVSYLEPLPLNCPPGAQRCADVMVRQNRKR